MCYLLLSFEMFNSIKKIFFLVCLKLFTVIPSVYKYMAVPFHRPGSSVKCSENDSLTDHPSYFRKLEIVFENNLTVNQHHV